MKAIDRIQFSGMLLKANGLDPQEFKCWMFSPGMLFNSPEKWWGDFGQRDFPHEGIDFCLYQDSSGGISRIDETFRIPAMHDGVVRALFKDYLGQAVVVEHDRARKEIGAILSIYAHTVPTEAVQPGAMVTAGEIIASVADTSRSKAGILPHLHLTLATPSPEISYESFVWNQLRDPDLVTLLDPLVTVETPIEVIDRRNFKDQLGRLA